MPPVRDAPHFARLTDSLLSAQIAERIMNYAKLVRRENVIGVSDCGFSSQATYTPEIHPTVVWAKFKAMAEGAQIATKKVWQRG
jgi:5-methyltetrahydropteroyltriglutamate--homocysteine methyltransferase